MSMNTDLGHSRGYAPEGEKVLRSWLGGSLREIRPGVFTYWEREFNSRALAAREAVGILQDSLSRMEANPFRESDVEEPRQRTHEEILELCNTILAERREVKVRAMRTIFENEKILQTVTGAPYEKSKNRSVALKTLRERFTEFFAAYPEALSDPGFQKELERVVSELESGESEKEIFEKAKKEHAASLESTRKLLREAIALMNGG